MWGGVGGCVRVSVCECVYIYLTTYYKQEIVQCRSVHHLLERAVIVCTERKLSVKWPITVVYAAYVNNQFCYK